MNNDHNTRHFDGRLVVMLLLLVEPGSVIDNDLSLFDERRELSDDRLLLLRRLHGGFSEIDERCELLVERNDLVRGFIDACNAFSLICNYL